MLFNNPGFKEQRKTNPDGGALYMGKMGSICHFSCTLPASIWGHCSQVLAFTSFWGTQKLGGHSAPKNNI